MMYINIGKLELHIYYSELEVRHDILIIVFQTVRVLTKTRLLLITELNTSFLNILNKINI